MKAKEAFEGLVDYVQGNGDIEEALEDLRAVAEGLGATEDEINTPMPKGLGLALPEKEEEDDEDEEDETRNDEDPD